jgi:hypothetical protein
MTGKYSCTKATKPLKFLVLSNSSPKFKNSLQEKMPHWQKDNGIWQKFILSEPGF